MITPIFIFGLLLLPGLLAFVLSNALARWFYRFVPKWPYFLRYSVSFLLVMGG